VLAFARGNYVTVFDPEDLPEPDQLKKALRAFRAGDRKPACVQARYAWDKTEHVLARHLASPRDII
jgi:cellulose synthase/poly-beta-1,6-N-acetylglucosamine synthase-like glycosyltransferase